VTYALRPRGTLPMISGRKHDERYAADLGHRGDRALDSDSRAATMQDGLSTARAELNLT
jgi:hypothetical protein